MTSADTTLVAAAPPSDPPADPPGAQRPERPAPTSRGRSVLLGIALAALVTVVVLAFSWPSVASEPRSLPIAVVGPEQAVSQLAGAIEQQGGALELESVEDRDAAVTAIERREVYGAIVLGPAPEVLTASAASPAVSQLLSGVAVQLQSQLAAQQAAQSEQAGAAGAAIPAAQAPEVTVTDVVPLLDTDPRGSGIVAAAFPLVLGGMIGGIAISLGAHGARRRVLALVVYAIAAGLAVAGIMQGWFQVIAGDYLLNASAFALSLLAIGAGIVGAATLIGRAGVAVGPIVFLLFANPIASAAAPKEFLPGSWGEIGQWFPPGAGATLVRDLSYFPEAPTAFPWLVLAVWAGGGLLLTAFAGVLHRRRARP